MIVVDEVEGLEVNPRLAIPVRVGGETFGSIWVVRGDTPLARVARTGLAGGGGPGGRGAGMIHARSSHDIERRVRGDLLLGLLEGRGSADSAAARLGIEPGSVVEVMAFELPPDADARRACGENAWSTS